MPNSQDFPFISHFSDKHVFECTRVVSPRVLNAEAVAMLVHHESLEWNLPGRIVGWDLQMIKYDYTS